MRCSPLRLGLARGDRRRRRDRAAPPGRVPAAAVHVRRDLLHRPDRAEHPHRLQRANLARPLRVRRHRRLRRGVLLLAGPGWTPLLEPPGWLPLGDGMRGVLTIPFAALVAGVFGYAFGLPAQRLAGVCSRSPRSPSPSRCRRSPSASTRSRAGAEDEPEPPGHPLGLGHLDSPLALLRGLGARRGSSR